MALAQRRAVASSPSSAVRSCASCWLRLEGDGAPPRQPHRRRAVLLDALDAAAARLLPPRRRGRQGAGRERAAGGPKGRRQRPAQPAHVRGPLRLGRPHVRAAAASYQLRAAGAPDPDPPHPSERPLWSDLGAARRRRRRLRDLRGLGGLHAAALVEGRVPTALPQGAARPDVPFVGVAVAARARAGDASDRHAAQADHIRGAPHAIEAARLALLRRTLRALRGKLSEESAIPVSIDEQF